VRKNQEIKDFFIVKVQYKGNSYIFKKQNFVRKNPFSGFICQICWIVKSGLISEKWKNGQNYPKLPWKNGQNLLILP